MTNKEAADKFGVPKNTISTWIKNKEKIFKRLKKVLQALRNYVVVNTKKSTRLCLKVCFTKEPEYTYRWVNDPRKRTFLCRKIGDP